MSTLAISYRERIQAPRFDLWMAVACLANFSISIAGYALTAAHIENLGVMLLALGIALAMVAPLPLYWHDKGRIGMRDAALTLPWAMVLAVILPLPVVLGAHLAFPLQDANLARMDAALGVSVPAIAAWAMHHWMGRSISSIYPLLNPLLGLSAILPALAGRVKAARRFLVANLLAFAIGIPVFALLPAVGPWYGSHFAPTASQMGCQASLLALRVPGLSSMHAAGVVCFPSFHVIWAILCAWTLCTFRAIRVPVAVLSAMIILSTMTTGWHYFSDVLAGVVIAAVSIWLASRLVRDPIAANCA